MKQKILTQCIKIAQKSLASHPEVNNFPHTSFIIQDKKLIEWATNNIHEPPKYLGYPAFKDSGYPRKFHSEVWAYKRAKGLLSKRPFEMINIRLNRKGKVKLSKPCPTCFNILKNLGCRTFFYSSDCGFLKLKT